VPGPTQRLHPRCSWRGPGHPLVLTFDLVDASLLLVNGLSLGLMHALLAVGLTLTYGMMGVLNFAHGSLFMLGAYLGWTASVWLPGGWASALLVSPGLVAGLGWLIHRNGLARLADPGQTRAGQAWNRDRHLREVLLTLAVSVVLAQFIPWIWGREALSSPLPPAWQEPLLTWVVPLTVSAVDNATPGGVSWVWGSAGVACVDAQCVQISRMRVFAALLAASGLGLLLWFLARSPWGLVIRAARTRPEVVRSLGFDVDRAQAGMFALGSGLAALAGVLDGAMRLSEPTMGAATGALVFALVVMGGLGSWSGAVWACLVVGGLEAWAIASPLTIATFPVARLVGVLPYVLLVLTLVVRPQGWVGSNHR
jgi:branched-chain amino acid transport system permease protein